MCRDGYRPFLFLFFLELVGGDVRGRPCLDEDLFFEEEPTVTTYLGKSVSHICAITPKGLVNLKLS